MLEYDFEDSVGYWVAITAHALRRALDSKLSQKNGITIRQWEVLACLALGGEMLQAEMAERLCIEPPTLAGILSRMERDGWLHRVCCADDRRKKLIRPTDKAEAIWQCTTRICREVREEATKGISADELQQFKSVCDRIRGNLDRVAANGRTKLPIEAKSPAPIPARNASE